MFGFWVITYGFCYIIWLNFGAIYMVGFWVITYGFDITFKYQGGGLGVGKVKG
jgi:hypothetical protein